MKSILSDREKIEKWNDICIMLGFFKSGETELWLRFNNVKYTPGGSVLAPDGFGLQFSTPDSAKGLITNVNSEQMATHILAVFSGRITFSSTAVEVIFWKEVIERLDAQFATFTPPDIVPVYVREVLKYPADGEGELPI